jgi:alpha-beta hydrolase superfamily lysophospholipase
MQHSCLFTVSVSATTLQYRPQATAKSFDAPPPLQFCLVGHDFGAALAWRLAMRAPGRVLKLVVISVGSPGEL